MKKFISTLAILLIGCILIISGCKTDDLTYAKRTVKNKFGVSLPEDTELEFFYKESTDFHGDTAMYFVFRFESVPTDIINSFQSNNLKSDEQGEESRTELENYFKTVSELIGDKISGDYQPDWNADFVWNFGERLNGMPAVYYPEILQMIVCYYTI